MTLLVEDLEEGDLFKFNGEVLEYIAECAERGLHVAASKHNNVRLSGKSEVEYAFRLENIIDGLRMGGEYRRRAWPACEFIAAPKDDYDWVYINTCLGTRAYRLSAEDIRADDWEEHKPADKAEECPTTQTS